MENAFLALETAKQLLSNDQNVKSITLQKIDPVETLSGTIHESRRAIVIDFHDVNDSECFSELEESMASIMHKDEFKVMYGDGDAMLVLLR